MKREEPTRSERRTPRTVRVLFFGAARDAAGCAEETITFAGPVTSAEALRVLCERHPPLARFERSLLVAINHEYAPAEKVVEDGDEIAVFPPVSGGQGEEEDGLVAIVEEPIDVGRLARRLIPPDCGATVTFDGYVRGWTGGRRTLYLVYEAYKPMALREMRRIGREARARFAIASISIVHRVGRLETGETSVCIVVSAPHRKEAFAACEWAIAELKRTVPIWKKEVFEDGEVWVEGESPATQRENAASDRSN